MKTQRLLPILLTILLIFLSNYKTFSQVYAGRDKEICSSVTYLNATNPYQAIGYWSVIRGNATFKNAYKPNTKVSNISRGVNVFRWIVGRSFDDVVITNNSVYSYAGPDQVLIAKPGKIKSKSTYLAANNPGIQNAWGYWSLVSGSGNISNMYQYNSKITNIPLGEHILKWRVKKGRCISSDYVRIKVKFPGDGPEDGWPIATSPNPMKKNYAESKKDNITEESLEEIKIYPNPSQTGIINIISKKMFEKANIEIYSITGALVEFKILEKSSDKITFSIKENKAGIYFIKIKNQNSVLTQKFILK